MQRSQNEETSFDSNQFHMQTLASSPVELARAKDASLGRNRKAKRTKSGIHDGEKQNMLEAVTEHEHKDEDEIGVMSPSSGVFQLNPLPLSEPKGEPATKVGLLPKQEQDQPVVQVDASPSSKIQESTQSQAVSATAAHKKLWRIDKIGDSPNGRGRESFARDSPIRRSASASFRPNSAEASDAASRPHSAAACTRPKSTSNLHFQSTLKPTPQIYTEVGLINIAPTNLRSKNNYPTLCESGNPRLICIRSKASNANQLKSDVELNRRLLQIQSVFSKEACDLLQIQDADARVSSLQSYMLSQNKSKILPPWILPPDQKSKRRMRFRSSLQPR